jgi:hypothetical protein
MCLWFRIIADANEKGLGRSSFWSTGEYRRNGKEDTLRSRPLPSSPGEHPPSGPRSIYADHDAKQDADSCICGHVSTGTFSRLARVMIAMYALPYE